MAGDEVIVAGAGIAGLTAALSLAARGLSVTVFERASHLEEVGAGLQLSPNATRILRSLGVLERLEGRAVRPDAVLLRDAATLAPLARLPLGEAAERRWGAPYLVCHRADLQRALLERLREEPAIVLETDAAVEGAFFGPDGVSVGLSRRDEIDTVCCRLLVGADGVWSGLRRLAGGGLSRFTGFVAFRAVLGADAATTEIVSPRAVTAFLAPAFHLVAYPLRGGAEINLVAVTASAAIPRRWANAADTAPLLRATARAAPALSALVGKAGAWTAWPIHEAAGGGRRTRPDGLALVGDAAHALSPYAAQGAAMAVEDAAVLAALAARSGDTATMLDAFERLRRPRLARVARRGRFNRRVWHAAGPVAAARNLALRLAGRERLAAGLDWLYGYDAEEAAEAGLHPSYPS